MFLVNLFIDKIPLPYDPDITCCWYPSRMIKPNVLEGIGIANGTISQLRKQMVDIHFTMEAEDMYTQILFDVPESMPLLFFSFALPLPSHFASAIDRKPLRSFTVSKDAIRFYFSEKASADDFASAFADMRTHVEPSQDLEYFDDRQNDLNALTHLVCSIPQYLMSVRERRVFLAALGMGNGSKSSRITKTSEGYTMSTLSDEEQRTLMRLWAERGNIPSGRDAVRKIARTVFKSRETFLELYHDLFRHILTRCAASGNSALTPLVSFIKSVQRKPALSAMMMRPKIFVRNADVHFVLTGTAELQKKYESLFDKFIAEAASSGVDLERIGTIEPYVFPGGVRFRYELRYNPPTDLDYIEIPGAIARLVDQIRTELEKIVADSTVKHTIMRLFGSEVFVKRLVMKVYCSNESIPMISEVFRETFSVTDEKVVSLTGQVKLIEFTNECDYALTHFERTFLRDCATLFRLSNQKMAKSMGSQLEAF